MERPSYSGVTQNQAAWIGLIVRVFLDNLAAVQSLKHFVNADESEGF